MPTKEKIRKYRNRAEELRTIAESMKDVSARATLLQVALDYESMATNLEAILLKQASLKPLDLEP